MRCLELFRKKHRAGPGNVLPNPGGPVPPPYVPPPPYGWSLGPVINGQNYSVGTACDPAGNFTWPAAQKGIDRWLTPGPHYLTKACNGLSGSSIRARYEIAGDGQFFGTVGSQSALVYVCLFFQAAGDNWSGVEPYEAHRWWTTETYTLSPGVVEISVPLTRDKWTSVYNRGTEEQFAMAKATAVRVGLTFGNDEGRGHGVSSLTGGSSFVLRSFAVE